MPGPQVKNWDVYHGCMKDKEDTDENKEMCAKIANAEAAGTLKHSDSATSSTDALSVDSYALLRESVSGAARDAADTIREAIYPELDYKSQPKATDTKNKAKSDQAALYNSHARAAHASTTQAYSSGSASDHEVASTHHDAAADHSGKAQDMHDAGSESHKDYKAAKDYHTAQSKAHKAAATTAARGNSFTHYDYPYNRY